LRPEVVVLPFFISPRIKLALAAWVICELIAFLVVVQWIGYGGAVLAGLLSSLVGFSMLKRAGASAMAKLRTGLGQNGRPAGPLLDDTLATVGAIAMLLPGFLSDVVGLALAVPGVRDRITRTIKGRTGRPAGQTRAKTAPSTIDLAPDEWRHTEPNPQPVSKI
jgi:UPF0716 protein FxsA